MFPTKPLALATNSHLKKEIKDMKTKLQLILMLTCFFCLTGCQSEVDKCTDALVKGNEPYKDNAQKASFEGDSRLECLKANRGK